MNDFSRTWITSNEILEEHKDLFIAQIYAWFITVDNNVVIVGKNEKFQFPGGKPEKDETVSKTIQRELYEEAGININEFNQTPEFFGYYLIENDSQAKWGGNPYLQLRYFIKVNKKADKIQLSVNEREDDYDQLEEAKFVPLKKLSEHIPWTKDAEEFEAVNSKV